MKKYSYKKYIYLILLALTVSSANTDCRRRHRWGGGWGGGLGYGLGWGYPGWGYGWGGPGITFAIGGGGRSARRNIRDDMGRNYWSVINNSQTPILVRASNGSYKRIQPGEKRNIHRRGSFKVKVKTPDGQRIKFRTQNHLIEISSNPMGKITYNSWNE